MITYSTNCMGPISNKWYEENGFLGEPYTKFSTILGKEVTLRDTITHWAGGRIDIRGVPDEPWGLEYGLPIMRAEDWDSLTKWLRRFSSEGLIERDKLLSMFEEETGVKIRWFKSIDKG